MVTTVTSMVRILAAGSGSDKQLNESILTEWNPQSGHTSVLLYMPCTRPPPSQLNELLHPCLWEAAAAPRLKVVRDERVVAGLVVAPSLRRHLLVRPPVRIGLLDVRLVLHPVQVLVEPVQEKGEELLLASRGSSASLPWRGERSTLLSLRPSSHLAVVLLVARKVRREAGDLLLEPSRSNRPHVALHATQGARFTSNSSFRSTPSAQAQLVTCHSFSMRAPNASASWPLFPRGLSRLMSAL